MTDVLSRLASSAVIVQGTTAPYTVPANKSARIRIQYRFTAGVNSAFRLIIAGMEIFRTGALTSTQVHYTQNALIFQAAATDATITGITDVLTVHPYQREWFLASGDTVQFVISTADLTAMAFHVVGAELDTV